MHIIPVIDLLNGVVVHAKQGIREHYQPIQSQLTQSHKALDIVAALLDVYPFTQLYIADLNAIQKLNDTYTSNLAIIESINEMYPQLTLWLDAGISNTTELTIWSKFDAKLIFGSESFAQVENYLSLKQFKEEHVLSLDFFAEGYRGPFELLNNPTYWPQDVIVMSLANVGANIGINTKQLSTVLHKAKNHHIYAAGGIRNYEDLTRLKSMKVKGALIATAIHQKHIASHELNALNNQ